MAGPMRAAGAAPGVLARLGRGLRYALTGAAPGDWFGPAAPLSPEAPVSVAGRQFDYPPGYNLRLTPRDAEPVSFAELRGLADHWDLLRLVIETRKDQIAGLDWTIQPRRRRAGAPPMARADDPRIAWLETFLADPDREHGWAGWLRMLLEDLFVIDAPTLYIHRDALGRLLALEPVDGATIKRVLAADGRTPAPPDPAFQQVLKGMPAVDYRADELIYAPRNPRAHRIYGCSPVEQVVMSANIALRRQLAQLAYFTEGNTPEALIGVPDAWTSEQIRNFQEYWDALLAGNAATRRHIRFVPGGLNYQPTRAPPLKDEFDEWLARIVCFAFSIPPSAFIRQINRATAETAQEAALAEGLAPLQAWVKGLIDRVIGQVLGWGDLEFAWAIARPVDPESQARIAASYVGAGIATRNEIRTQLGLPALPGGDAPTIAGPVTPLAAAIHPPPALAKAGFDPGEPRDNRGRWTTEGGGASGPAAPGTNTAMPIHGKRPLAGRLRPAPVGPENRHVVPAQEFLFDPPAWVDELAPPKGVGDLDTPSSGDLAKPPPETPPAPTQPAPQPEPNAPPSPPGLRPDLHISEHRQTPERCPEPGPDRPGGKSERALLYQHYVATLMNPDDPLKLGEAVRMWNPVSHKFTYYDDCRRADVVLIDAKGEGYEKAFFSNSPGYRNGVINDLVAEAQRQIDASAGLPIEWHFAEKGAADFIRSLFAKRYPRIKIIYTPWPSDPGP